jgi:hypothetical protein
MKTSPTRSANRTVPGTMHRDRLSSPRDPMPTFLVIGAMKAGTTSLFRYLEPHPQVFMPRLKELDFFVAEANWGRGLSWYRRQFRQAGEGTIALGEASPTYSKYPEFDGVPQRIASCVPNVRLIYVVRDPVDRIRSHYDHRVLVGTETEPIERAVFRDPSYINCSRYGLQVRRYLDWFPREQLLIITSEDLRWRRAETLRRVHRFLGVDPNVLPPTLNAEYFVTSERESYPAIVWWTRRGLKHLIPPQHRWRIRRSINQALTVPTWVRRAVGPREAAESSGSQPASPNPVSEEPHAEVPPALRQRLNEVLRDDVASLRQLMPEGFDGWGIAA